MALQEIEKEGEPECTPTPLERDSDKAEATVSSPVLQSRNEAIWLARHGLSFQAGTVRGDFVVYE